MNPDQLTFPKTSAFPVYTEAEAHSLRNIARLRERSSECTLQACLDEVAIEAGFRGWSDVERALRFTAQLEAKMNDGLCLLVERAAVTPEKIRQFQPMPLLWELRKRDVVLWWRSVEDRVGNLAHGGELRRKSRREIYIDVPRDYMGLRYVGEDPLPAPDDVLLWAEHHGYVYPEIAWLYGKCLSPEVLYFLDQYA